MAQETIIRPAPEVETIATQLIAEYHPELSEACILYLFTTAAASCVPQKCNPKVRYLASLHVPRIVKAEVASGPDFLVWVNELEWSILVTGQHRPFVDHVLTHASREETEDGTPRWIVKPHGIEDFPEVLQRFGAWNATIKQVRDLLQPELDLGFSNDPSALGTSIQGVTINAVGRSVTMTGSEFDDISPRIP